MTSLQVGLLPHNEAGHVAFPKITCSPCGVLHPEGMKQREYLVHLVYKVNLDRNILGEGGVHCPIRLDFGRVALKFS